MSESANNISNWGLRDPDPGALLDEIYPFSRRATALIARSAAKTLLQTHFLQIAGTLSILEGLEYHRERFAETIARLASGLTVDHKPLRHEAVAYVNRAGQFYFFANSNLVKQKGNRPPIPYLKSIIHFRHKHTAHRSIDDPRPDDTEELQAYQAMSMGSYYMLFQPRSHSTLQSSGTIWSRSYAVFQISTGEGKFYHLNIERDHDALMAEAYAVLEYVLM
jgi:hypothetical protein